MLCEFEQITERNEHGTADFQCKVCKRIVYRVKSKSADKIVASCATEGKRKPLTLLDMAASAARAATRFAASGGKTVSAEVREQRLATCAECPAFETSLLRCGDCGCFMQIKTWLPSETCPRNKWPSSPAAP